MDPSWKLRTLWIALACWIIPLIIIIPTGSLALSTYRPADGNWCDLNTGYAQLKLSSPSDHPEPFSSSSSSSSSYSSSTTSIAFHQKRRDVAAETTDAYHHHYHHYHHRHRYYRRPSPNGTRDSRQTVLESWSRTDRREEEAEARESTRRVWISSKRDGSVWTRLGRDRLADDWTHDRESERSYHGLVLGEEDVKLLSRLEYTGSCVLTDLELDAFSASAWQPSYLVAFEPVEKRNRIVTIKHHKDCSAKALVSISDDGQRLRCSYESRELGRGLGFGSIEGSAESIERGVCGQKPAANESEDGDTGTLFLRDFSFDPEGEESWKCHDDAVVGWNAYRFRGSYYFAYVKVAECSRPTSSTNLGHEPKLRPNSDQEGNQLVLPDPTQTFIDDATVIAWQVFVKMVSHQHSVYLQVWRPKIRGAFDSKVYDRRRFTSVYALIGQTFFRPKTLLLHTLTLTGEERIAVRRGDVLGFYHPQSNPLAFDFVPCASSDQLVRRSKLPVNFQREVKVGEVFGFQSHVTSNRSQFVGDGGGGGGGGGGQSLEFPSNRSSDVLCRQYSFAAVLANASNPTRTRTIDDWSCPDHRGPFHPHRHPHHPSSGGGGGGGGGVPGVASETQHFSSSSSNLHTDDVTVDRKHDEFRSRHPLFPLPRHRHHQLQLHHPQGPQGHQGHQYHNHLYHQYQHTDDADESYFVSVIVIIVTSCLMVVMFCLGVASYLLATNCK